MTGDNEMLAVGEQFGIILEGADLGGVEGGSEFDVEKIGARGYDVGGGEDGAGRNESGKPGKVSFNGAED